MNNWKKCKLGDIGSVITGKIPSAKNPEDWGNNMCFIIPTDYKDYRKIASSSIRKLSNIGIERLKNKILPPKSIMVTCIGSDMGKVAVNKSPSITNQQINSIILHEKIADADFVYYLLVSMYDTLRVYGLDGTAVPILNKSDFETIEILLPPLKEQR
ncbi:restriction endonuclease subunit S [Campylobacter canadensis]|uniref:restriction endonuclease subunit S n=1 Tax=Campylobacter canadensis TaxID=449520 RepID=UPI0015544D64|nr:restriction endonuclease subunit S [Campylobacter canadensis]MBZ7995085.1 restriction endonuclease subunit S [Campylobacter canadensis]MBZ7996641.1 restriction endonuclease subunit S [Campylobacter canadensis]MBZ8000248.1 restriction endonuclease subunit S [Campylobacter canadensis]MBZ8002270.1 restriction endonuclease subunit S [Campylobacter canadensis]MBZ8003425.1 restriction endonuclease subunit S [Campylobacter canadensis]